MANSYLLETLRETAATNRLQIATLIGTLSRSVELLTVDIEHEEARAGVRGLSDRPMLARSLRTRRDNIGATIASLEALVRTQGGLSAASKPAHCTNVKHSPHCIQLVEPSLDHEQGRCEAMGQ